MNKLMSYLTNEFKDQRWP